MEDKQLEFIKHKSDEVLTELHKVIIGQDETLEMMLIAIFANGHALLEGVPGTAKTLAVHALSLTLNADFKRIQFTPDLMPSDILGTSIFDLPTKKFIFKSGPVFTDLLLADEINRTPAKTQAALLELMQEKKATIDGVSYPVSNIFTVYATQNPIEYEGTYPLPEAQLDRFMFKILIDYPNAEQENTILKHYHRGPEPHNLKESGIKPVLTKEEVDICRRIIKEIDVEDSLIDYIRQIVAATRNTKEILVGCGPRAGIHLLLSSKAAAALAGRKFVIPDDIKRMSYPTLGHRLVVHPEAEVDGMNSREIIDTIFSQINVPR